MCVKKAMDGDVNSVETFLRYRILLLAYCCGGFFLVLDQELIFEFL